MTLAASVIVTLFPVATAHGAVSAKAWDFNGDGYRDLVVGLPFAQAGGHGQAGYVVVIPGSAAGPTSSRRFIVSQSSSGIPGVSEAYDHFGESFTSADLNHDGYAELVVAAPGEDPFDLAARGRITILWGSRTWFHSGSTVSGPNADGSLGKKGLALADVTGDGRADIVGLGTSLATTQYRDPIHVIKGPFAPGGSFTAKIAGRLPENTVSNAFAVGDFDGDTHSDVAVTFTGFPTDGTFYLHGTATGLTPTSDWYAETTSPTIATADFNADGYGDLAYGGARIPSDLTDPQYPIATGVGGTVRITYGGPEGPAGTRPPDDFSQETPGVPGSGAGPNEASDAFGAALATADVDGNGHPDLAIGVPNETIGTANAAGAATVLYSNAGGLGATNAQNFTQATPGVSGTSEPEDLFGLSVRLRDLNGNGRPDLVVGSPGENNRSGRALVLPGSAQGVTGLQSQSYSPTSMSLPHNPRFFGRYLG